MLQVISRPKGGAVCSKQLHRIYMKPINIIEPWNFSTVFPTSLPTNNPFNHRKIHWKSIYESLITHRNFICQQNTSTRHKFYDSVDKNWDDDHIECEKDNVSEQGEAHYHRAIAHSAIFMQQGWHGTSFRLRVRIWILVMIWFHHSK